MKATLILKATTTLTILFGLAACQTAKQDKGSLSDFSVSSNAYVRAYDQQFSRQEDRAGWSQALQLAWSRGAAAEVCGLSFDREAYLNKLVADYSEADRLTHDLNGLRWHAGQIREAGDSFCTDERIADAQKYL